MPTAGRRGSRGETGWARACSGDGVEHLNEHGGPRQRAAVHAAVDGGRALVGAEDEERVGVANRHRRGEAGVDVSLRDVVELDLRAGAGASARSRRPLLPAPPRRRRRPVAGATRTARTLCVGAAVGLTRGHHLDVIGPRHQLRRQRADLRVGADLRRDTVDARLALVAALLVAGADQRRLAVAVVDAGHSVGSWQTLIVPASIVPGPPASPAAPASRTVDRSGSRRSRRKRCDRTRRCRSAPRRTGCSASTPFRERALSPRFRSPTAGPPIPAPDRRRRSCFISPRIPRVRRTRTISEVHLLVGRRDPRADALSVRRDDADGGGSRQARARPCVLRRAAGRHRAHRRAVD